MSDFVNEFWNWYVIIITLVSVIGCAVLLWVQSKAKFNAGKTCGHVWDETLEEYNNPMPKWWSWLFYITVIFSLVYLVLYPGPDASRASSAGRRQGSTRPRSKGRCRRQAAVRQVT